APIRASSASPPPIRTTATMHCSTSANPISRSRPSAMPMALAVQRRWHPRVLARGNQCGLYLLATAPLLLLRSRRDDRRPHSPRDGNGGGANLCGLPWPVWGGLSLLSPVGGRAFDAPPQTDQIRAALSAGHRHDKCLSQPRGRPEPADS